MKSSLLDLNKLTSYAQTFQSVATGLGFASVGEIDRFIFQSYGNTIREISAANRPRGAIFVLGPPGTTDAIATPAALKPVLLSIQAQVANKFFYVPIDLTGGATVASETTSGLQRQMALGAWPMGQAQMLSRSTKQCVVWANGVGVSVFLDGDTYLESPDVVEGMPTGLPSTFQSLSWDNGAIVYEFAENELNDTTETGIWRLPEEFLLRPKPEKMMSVGLGRFLKLRMAGYRHHEDEAHVENEGRSDISLVLYNGLVHIIEVKWVGSSLVATKEMETDATIKSEIKKSSRGWVTEFDDTTFRAGARQLTKYFKTGKYNRAYLAVFDCCKPTRGRVHEVRAIDAGDVAPHDAASFRSHRACVDPRKASTSSKVAP